MFAKPVPGRRCPPVARSIRHAARRARCRVPGERRAPARSSTCRCRRTADGLEHRRSLDRLVRHRRHVARLARSGRAWSRSPTRSTAAARPDQPGAVQDRRRPGAVRGGLLRHRTTGNNQADPQRPGYPATQGWDPVTGLGTPNAAAWSPTSFRRRTGISYIRGGGCASAVALGSRADRPVILENGVIRTLDPSLPKSRALAIAGDRDRGRRRRARDGAREPGDDRSRRPLRAARLHRLARPLPDVGTRAARGAARRLRIARRGARAHPRARRRPAAGCAATAGAAATGRPAASRRATTSTRSPATARRADREGLPLALAQLGWARARGRRPRVAGGVVERDENGEPTGVLREEAAWRFKERYLRSPTTTTSRRCARASGSRTPAASPRCTTRTAGSARCGCGSGSTRGHLSLRVWQSMPYEPVDQRRALGLRRARQPAAAARLPEGLHGRNARLADRVDARRQRRPDHERR